jgi:adenosylhomocysteine nucleosidase
MKILLVDDDHAKARVVARALEASSDPPPQGNITVVHTLSAAVVTTTRETFDLIVLDLMLPYFHDGPTTSLAGLELLRVLRSPGSTNENTTVIGISSFPEEVEVFRPRFEEYGVLIIRFDEDGDWSQVLARVQESARAHADPRIRVEFLVICELDKERDAFARTAFEKQSEAIVSGLNVHYYRLPGEQECFGGVIRLSQMGLVAATCETALALNVFRTQVLYMSGICAGFDGQSCLGQLVIASPAWEYQAGKWAHNKFEIAPLQIPLRPATRSLIDQIIARDSFSKYVENNLDRKDIRPAKQHQAKLAPDATGSPVVANRSRLSHITPQHRKLAALDMESFGMYYVAHEREAQLNHFFAINCVVDFADENKGDYLHNYGCVVSARATEQIIRELVSTRRVT